MRQKTTYYQHIVEHVINPILNDAIQEQGLQRIGPRDNRLDEMLAEILRDEYSREGVLLTAVVVRKEAKTPGDGFYSVARGLGLEVDDKAAFWSDQLNKVFKCYARRAAG